MDSALAVPSTHPRRLPRIPRGDLFACLAMLGVALAFFAPVWLSGKVWIDGDLGDFYWPTLLTTFAALRRGELPLWSPDMFGGFPLFADGSVGALFPLNWTLLVFPHGLMLIPFGRLLLAAFGMYLLARRLGVGPTGGAVAGLVFALNGFSVGHFTHIDLANGTALLPYTLLAAEMSWRAAGWRNALRWLLVAGMAHGLAWLSLHPQAPLMILPIYAAWVLYRGLTAPNPRPRGFQPDGVSQGESDSPLPLGEGQGEGPGGRAKPVRPSPQPSPNGRGGTCSQGEGQGYKLQGRLAWVRVREGFRWTLAALALPLALALGLSAVQVLPMLDLGALSPRHDWGQTFNQSFSLPPYNLVGLVWPTFFHSAVGEPAWGLWNLETLVYLGTLPLVLALVALVAWPRGRHVGFFALVGGLALWTAFGLYVPFGPQPLLYSLPGYSVLRAPARFFYLVGFAGAYLAAVGADWLLARAWSASALRRLAGLLAGLSALALLIPVAAAYTLDFLRRQPRDAERLIKTLYLDLPHVTPLTVPDVVQALQRKLAPGSVEMWEATAWLMLAALLTLAWTRGWLGRRIFQAALVGLTGLNLVLLATRYVTPVPLARVVEPAPVVDYLGRQLGGDRFYNAAPVDSPPLSHLPFGVADFHGQSSLTMARTDEFTGAATRTETRLLDLAGVRYVLMPEGFPDTRGWIHQVGFRHQRPIVVLDSETSPGLSAFVVPDGSPPAQELRLLVALGNAAEVRQGAEIALVTVTSPSGATRRFPIRAGLEASDIDYHRVDVYPTVRHLRVPPAWKWGDRDERGIGYDRLMFYLRFTLDPRGDFTADRVQFQVTEPRASLIVFGASLVQPTTNAVVSLTRYHLARYRLVYADREVRLYANRTALPRAYLVGQAVHYDERRAALDRLLRSSFDVSRRITLEGEVPPEAAALVVPAPTGRLARLPAAPDPAELGSVELVDDRPTHVSLRARTTAPAFLYLADTYYPHWEARVDGQPTPILLANTIFRAVYLPPGDHTVTFDYNAASVRLGAVITLATLAALMGLGWATRYVVAPPARG